MKLGEIGDNCAETWRYDPSKIINTVSPSCTYAWIMMCQQLNNCGHGMARGAIDQWLGCASLISAESQRFEKLRRSTPRQWREFPASVCVVCDGYRMGYPKRAASQGKSTDFGLDFRQEMKTNRSNGTMAKWNWNNVGYSMRNHPQLRGMVNHIRKRSIHIFHWAPQNWRWWLLIINYFCGSTLSCLSPCAAGSILCFIRYNFRGPTLLGPRCP